MADVQILRPEAVSAPFQYPVSPNVEFVLKAVSAQIDGSGAAGAFLPLLVVESDAGEIVAQSDAPEVAAGASTRASWFPFVTETPAAATGTGIQWAYISGGGTAHTCPPASTTRIAASAGTFYTNAPSLFDTHLSGGGVQGLRLLADGHYFVTMTVRPTAGVTAGSSYELVIEGGGEFPDFNLAPYSFVTAAGGNTDYGSLESGGVMCVGGFITPPTDALVCRIDNLSANTLHFEYGGLLVWQLDAVNQDLN